MNNWWFTDAPFLGKSPLLLTLSMLTELCWLNSRFLHSWLISVQCCAPGSLESGSWLRPLQNSEGSDWVWLGKSDMEEEGVILVARFEKNLTFSLLFSLFVSLELWKLFAKHRSDHAKMLFLSSHWVLLIIYLWIAKKRASNHQWLQQLLTRLKSTKTRCHGKHWVAILWCHRKLTCCLLLLQHRADGSTWLARFQYE